MNPNSRNSHKRKYDDFIKYSSLGFEMIAIMAAGAYGGYKTDQWLKNEKPVFLFLFMILSVVIATVHAIKNFIKK